LHAEITPIPPINSHDISRYNFYAAFQNSYVLIPSLLSEPPDGILSGRLRNTGVINVIYNMLKHPE
jgi:hypothetical protein